MKPHKHAELIKAWADGARIEVKVGHWVEVNHPDWSIHCEYRIFKEPDIVEEWYVESKRVVYFDAKSAIKNLQLTFDSETGKLKSAKVFQ